MSYRDLCDAIMESTDMKPRNLYREAYSLVEEKSLSRFLEVQASILQALISQSERQADPDVWLRDHVIAKFLAYKFKILTTTEVLDSWWAVQKQLRAEVENG